MNSDLQYVVQTKDNQIAHYASPKPGVKSGHRQGELSTRVWFAESRSLLNLLTTFSPSPLGGNIIPVWYWPFAGRVSCFLSQTFG